MMTHAFEQWEVRVVRIQTDARNVRSRRAIERLGCALDGVLRADRPAADGGVRDTACYSMLDQEWPLHRRRLVERLGGSEPREDSRALLQPPDGWGGRFLAAGAGTGNSSQAARAVRRYPPEEVGAVRSGLLACHDLAGADPSGHDHAELDDGCDRHIGGTDDGGGPGGPAGPEPRRPPWGLPAHGGRGRAGLLGGGGRDRLDRGRAGRIGWVRCPTPTPLVQPAWPLPPVLRQQQTHRGHGLDPRRPWLLAGGLRRRGVQLR